MRFVIVCNESFEDIVAQEVKDILGIETEVSESRVFFDCSFDEIVKFTYRTQSAKRILIHLSSFSLEDGEGQEEILSHLKRERESLSKIDGSFCVRSSMHSLERPIGSAIHEILDDPEVDMESPDYLVYAHAIKEGGHTDVLLGIDITQKDLSKRDYRVFAHPSSIKGTLGFFMLMLSGYKRGDMILDPCSGSGTICAEAAYRASGISPRFYGKQELFSKRFYESSDAQSIMEKEDAKFSRDDIKRLKGTIISYDVDLQAVNSAKKNFKIGGVDRLISSAKGDIDWLETKFDEASVKHIVSNPPEYNKFNSKKMDKFYDVFFYQTEFVLADEGDIVILCNSENIVKIAERYSLELNMKRDFMHGNTKRHIFRFKKKPKGKSAQKENPV